MEHLKNIVKSDTAAVLVLASSRENYSSVVIANDTLWHIDIVT